MARVDQNQKPTIIKYGNIDKAVLDGAEKAFLEIATRTVTVAKSAVPVDLGVLGASIMATTSLDPDVGYGDFPKGKGGGGIPPRLPQKPGKLEAYVGSAVDYAVYQEFGTRKMAAQPYLRPAIQIVAGHGKAKEIVKKYNSDEVKNAVKNSVPKVVR